MSEVTNGAVPGCATCHHAVLSIRTEERDIASAARRLSVTKSATRVARLLLEIEDAKKHRSDREVSLSEHLLRDHSEVAS